MTQVLITRARFGTTLLWPGSRVDPASFNVAALAATGARLLPESASLLEAAARADLVRTRGGSIDEAEAIMNEAAARELVSEAGGPATSPHVALPSTFDEAVAYFGDRLAAEFQLAQDGVLVVASDSVVGDDSNYWTFEVGYFTAAGAFVSLLTGTTQVTGGVGSLPIGKSVSLGAVAAQALPAGAVLTLSAATTGSPVPAFFAVYLAQAA